MQKSFTAKQKFSKIMRVCTAQALIAVVISSMAIAHDNLGQVLERKVTLDVQKVSLQEALLKLEHATSVKIFYSSDQLDLDTKVTIIANNETLKQVLDNLLGPYHIEYTVFEQEQAITLKRIRQPSTDHPGERTTYSTDAAQARVTGTVRDMSGKQPLAGVNVLIKGTINGATTDAVGSFSIQAETGNVLMFSFIGYKTAEVTLASQTSLEVFLEEDVSALGEVVINAGYYNVDEKERTGNISSVGADIIAKQPVSNPLAALEGRMPGVQITQTTGVPGGGFKIQIRGQNSLRDNGNDPFYIVDGVPFTATPLTSTTISGSIIKEGNPLAAINPADIESIEVLKDADATAIYGSRGSNGVVIITTKRGKAGKTKLDINVRTGFGNVISKMDLLNTHQYIQMRKEAFANDNRRPNVGTGYDLLSWDTTRYTNWQKKLIGGTARATNAQLTFSGGDANTQFSVSGGYYKETTVFPGNFNFQRFSGAFNVNHTSADSKFKASISANYTSTLNNLFGQDLTGIALKMSPNAPALYDSTGKINADWKNGFTQNPLFSLNNKYKSTTDNIVTSAMLSYQIAPGLRIRSNLGFTSMQVNELATNPLSSIPPQFLTVQTGSASFGNSSLKTWILEPQIDYTNKIGQGILCALAGSTFQNSLQAGQTLTGRGYTSDALIENILAATAVNVNSATYSQYRYAAVFGRLNYNFQEKYILNLTARRDGSSRFGPGKRFGNFGAVGAAWIFSNTEFVKNKIGALSFGKLRTSYGVTGSDAIGNYQYLNSYSSTPYPYNNTSGLVLTRLTNLNYSWETNRKFEAGLDLGFLRDRIYFSAAWYRNTSSNQLVGLPLPLTTGQSSVQFNFPATVQNQGIELQITTTNYSNHGIKWTTAANLTIPTTRLVKFPDLASFPQYSQTYEVGSSIFKQRTLQSTGVSPTTGLYTFRDANGDGVISSADDGYFLKSIAQKFYGGLNNAFIYKGFQLDIFFQFVKQTGQNYKNAFGTPGILSNQPVEVTARWHESGENSTVQKYSSRTSATYINEEYSDASISDASFVRLKNASISWNIPQVWTQKAKISGSKIFVQCQNLLTITRYKGLDPENRNTFFLPPLRVITAGCQITF